MLDNKPMQKYMFDATCINKPLMLDDIIFIDEEKWGNTYSKYPRNKSLVALLYLSRCFFLSMF
jgi:hypothetical protein